MPLKIKDKNGNWVIDQKAIQTSILDIQGNFKSKNVEGALRELAEAQSNRVDLSEIEAKVERNRVNINNINSKISNMEDDIEWLMQNGGSGGGGTNIVPTIKSDFQDCAIDKGSDVIIPIFFSAPTGGNGTAFITVNNLEVDNVGVKQGNNNIKVLGKYLTATENKVSIYVRDRAGLVSNQLTWTIIAGGITLTTNFNYETDWGITDEIRMPYNIETGVEGDIILHLTVGGNTYEIPSNNGYNEYLLSGLGLTLGTHSTSMYATIGKYKSNEINFNLVIVSTSELYVSTTNKNDEQYTYGVPVSINYRLSKKTTETYDVTIFVDNVIIKTEKRQVGNYFWTATSSNGLTIGKHTIKIQVESQDKSEIKIIEITLEIIKGVYVPLEDYTYGLLCDLNATGKSNDDTNNGLWNDDSGNNNHGKLIGFNFGTNGFIGDELICDNDAYVEIPFSPWSDNAPNGSTIDIIYTPFNTGMEDCRVIDYTTVTDPESKDEIKPFKGIFADIRQGIVSSAKSGTNSGNVTLDDESGEIHLTWVLDRHNKFCKTYINGVLSRIMFLSDSVSGNNKVYEDFSHDSHIFLNSTKGENCGTNNIKRFRVWNHALTSDDILKTHLANIKDLEEQERLYNFNYNNTTLPRMDLYGDITNMTHEQTVDMRIQYTSPNEEKYGASFNTGIQNNPVKIQGTSSLQYVRKNYTIYLKDEYGSPMMYNPYGEGNAMPDSVFCLKADYIESSHGNNTGIANFVNDNVYDTKLPPQLENPSMRTTIAGFPIVVYMNGEYLGVYNFNHDRYSIESYGYDYKKYPNMLVYEINSNSNTSAGAFYRYDPTGKNESSQNISEIGYYKRDFGLIYGNRTADSDTFSEIKTLVEWVDTASQDIFREAITEHFNKEYLFRYLLTVLMVGGVDSLGKNMKINTFDGKVWYPTFYDIDTCLGINNSGALTIQPDVEIEDGSFNTSNSNLWTKVLNYFTPELKQEWANMRQKNFTLDNLMQYVIKNQIEVIPAKFYNDDAQVKYLDFGSLYTFCCHGSKELLVKRWLRERIAYVDSMLEYFTSQNDQITIRMNKTGLVEFDVTSYIPLYFSVKWSNAQGGTQTIKVKRGQKATFNYTSTTSTDQEIIIYHAGQIKNLDRLSNLNPSSCILSNAKKLTEVEIHSEILYNINVTENIFLRKLDLRNCTMLGTVVATGSTIDLSKCKYLKYVDTYGTGLTSISLNSKGGSLREIYYPKTLQDLTLIKQTLLETVGLPYGSRGEDIPSALYNIEITDCPNIKTLNTSTNPSIAKTMASMVYCNNLYLRNSLDQESIRFDGFQRLRNVTIENMNKLQSLGFDDMLSVGRTPTIKYIGLSNCPQLENISMNVTGDGYTVSFANDAIVDFGRLTSLKNISSNCVIKGLKTLVVPKSLESMFFTNEYGEGYSDMVNIWSGEVCSVNTDGQTATVTHIDRDYLGIDFKGLKLKNIDLGALVNIPAAINFSLSPTTVNPNFNKNRDGETYPYLQPVGTLDLSNYTESLARFFDGVNLEKLILICDKELRQTDLSYCFYNAFFENDYAITPVTSKLTNATNLDYCFYSTTVTNADVLKQLKISDGASMNYTFAKCKNIRSLSNLIIPDTISSAKGTFSECENLTTVTNIQVLVNDSVADFFKGCSRLNKIILLSFPNAKYLTSVFEGCTALTVSPLETISDNVLDIENIFKGSGITSLSNLIFGENITNANNFIADTPLTTIENLTFNTNKVKFTNCKSLKNIRNITFSENINDISSFFEGCTSLIDDIEIPLHIRNASNLFKNCTGIVNITSNWNREYEYNINSSNCYEGCTSIQYIDREYMISYDGDNGLDYVPSAWGGGGFTNDITSVYVFDTRKLSDGRLIFESNEILQPYYGITSWGDGTVDNSRQHTYAEEGEYIVKTKTLISGYGIQPSSSCQQSLVSVKKLKPNINDMSYIFKGCENLIELAMRTYDMSNVTTLAHAFNGCSKLVSIPSSSWITTRCEDFTYTFANCTSIKTSPDISLIGANKINYIYSNCSSLNKLTFNNLLYNIEDVTGIIDGCNSLTTVEFKNRTNKDTTKRIIEEINRVLSTEQLIEENLEAKINKLQEETTINMMAIAEIYELILNGDSLSAVNKLKKLRI